MSPRATPPDVVSLVLPDGPDLDAKQDGSGGGEHRMAAEGKAERDCLHRCGEEAVPRVGDQSRAA